MEYYDLTDKVLLFRLRKTDDGRRTYTSNDGEYDLTPVDDGTKWSTYFTVKGHGEMLAERVDLERGLLLCQVAAGVASVVVKDVVQTSS